MDLTTINDFYESIKTINKKVDSKRLNSPGTMNIAEIMNRHHLENQHSNILAFLLDPNEKHNHKDFGESFLSLLKNIGLSLKGNSIVSVKREDTTDEARRIDIFIETDSDYIIIENKIYADDQPKQITDYLESSEKLIGSRENIFVVYLTPFPKKPSEDSISSEELQILINNNHFINLTYNKDILLWLENLKNFKEGEETLKAGLLQYIDVVKAITNQRQETFNMDQEISKELVKVYGNLNREQLREKMTALYEFQNHINLVLYINFFEDICNESKGRIKLFCNNKFDYKTSEDWRNDVVSQLGKFGVRCCENNLTQDLFVQDLNVNRLIFACKEEELYDYGKPVNVEGYKSAAEPGSWFVNAILALNDWEQKAKKKLATHVVTNWFNLPI